MSARVWAIEVVEGSGGFSFVPSSWGMGLGWGGGE